MWRAQLEGDPESLEILRKNFENFVIFEDDSYFLKCLQFEKDNLKPFAEKVLKNMIYLLNLNLEEKCIANVQGTFENPEEGEKTQFVNAHVTLSAKVRAEAVVMDKNGNVIERPISDPHVITEDLEKSLKCIANNVHIELALEYYNGCKKHNIAFNLYTILEIIGEDLGSKENIYQDLSISRNKFKLLRRTLNYGLGNRSRHYNHNHPPANFYSEEKVKNLVKSILKEWFDKKCL